jgi:hypothetical protein
MIARACRGLGILAFVLVTACQTKPRAYVPLSGVALGGDAFSTGDGAQSGAADAPVVTLGAVPARVRGGSTLDLAVSVTAALPIVAMQLQYASDGEHVTRFVDVDPSAGSVSWTFDVADTTGARLRLIAVDNAGKRGAALSDPFTIDSTGPTVPAFAFSVPPLTREHNVVLEIASCGDADELLITEAPDSMSGGEPEYLWQACVTTPGRAVAPSYYLAADGDHTLHVWARDDVQNRSAASVSADVTLDTTAPVVTLMLPALLGTGDAIGWSASDLHLLAGSAVIEISADGGTNYMVLASGLPTTGAVVPAALPPPALAEGAYRVRVSVADGAGNVGVAESSGSVPYDPLSTVPPAITVVAPASGAQLAGNTMTTIQWIATEHHGDASGVFTIERYDGSAWSLIGTKTAGVAGAWSAQPFSFVWTTDATSIANAQIRVSYTNGYGLSGTGTGASFVIDATKPVVSAVTVNGGVSLASNNVLTVSVTAADPAPSTGVAAYMLATDPAFTGGVWLASAPPTFPFPHATGTYRLYVKVRDGVGNESVAFQSSDMTLSIADPPIVNFVLPTGSVTYGTGSPIDISWTIALQGPAVPLVPNSMRVLYSTDHGGTLVPWPSGSGLSSGDNGGGCTIAGATGCVKLTVPAAALASGSFNLILQVDDQAGNTGQVMSVPLNGPPIKLFAGRDASAFGGSATSTALRISAIGRDPVTGDIYVGAFCHIGVIRAQTGVIEPWIGNPNNCAYSGDGGPRAGVTFYGNPTDITVDAQQNVYWTAYAMIWRYDRQTDTAAIYAGCVDNVANCAQMQKRRTMRVPSFGGFTRVRVGAGGRVYFDVLDTCQGEGCSQIYRVEDDGTSITTLGGVIGGPPGPSPTEGGDPTAAGLVSFALAPGATTVQDRVFVMGRGWFANTFGGVWELVNGQLHSIDPTRSGQLAAWLPSRHLLAINDNDSISMKLVDPDSTATPYAPRPITDAVYGITSVQDDGVHGYYYMGDRGDYVSYVDALDAVYVYAGTDPAAGDGGPATSAELRTPKQVTFDSAGNAYIADTINRRMRKVASGIITTARTNFVGTLSGGIAPSGPVHHTGVGGLLDVGGACLWYCGGVADASHPFAPFVTSAASAVNLAVARSVPMNSDYVEQLFGALDGTTIYLHEAEYYTLNGGTPQVEGHRRTYIKKILSDGSYAIVAGLTGVTGTTGLTGVTGDTPLAHNLPLLGNSAGFPAPALQNGTSFRAVNDKLYVIENAVGTLYAGVEGGNWARQCGRTMQGFAVDRTNDNVYFVSSGVLYRLPYSVTGSTGATGGAAVADFSTIFSAPIVQAIEQSVAPHTVFISDQNAIYEYTDPAGIP